jgi:hypothetical protein
LSNALLLALPREGADVSLVATVVGVIALSVGIYVHFRRLEFESLSTSLS